MAVCAIPGILNSYRSILEREFHPLREFEHIVEVSGPTTEEWEQREFGDAHRLRQYKFWREAFIAAKYARLTGQLNAELEMMPEGDAGDFAIRIGNSVSVYEATEVLDVEARRRHDNLSRVDRMRVEQVSEEELSGALARRLIPQRIAEKASNSRYGPQVGLVIYVNLWTDFERSGTAGLLPAVSIPFKTIWLLADGKALCILSAERPLC